MKRKVYLAFAVLLVVGILFSACAPKAEEYHIGYIVADLENPAWNAMATGWKDKATELGMVAEAVNSSGQANTQFKHAQDMVTKEYDAVVVSGTDSSTANAAVKEFNAAGIPVWILHIKPDDASAEYVAMVDAQNEQGNYDAGSYLADKYASQGMSGPAAEITISLARSNGAARHAGFQKAMDEAGIELIEVKEAITYTRDESYQFAQDLISAHPDLSMIWCNYDEAALGALKAIEDAGKSGEIMVGGFDGSPESLKAVMDGKMTVMAVQPLYDHGTIVAQQMYDFLADGVQPSDNSTDCPLVTLENAETEAPKYLSACFGPTAKFPE